MVCMLAYRLRMLLQYLVSDRADQDADCRQPRIAPARSMHVDPNYFQLHRPLLYQSILILLSWRLGLRYVPSLSIIRYTAHSLARWHTTYVSSAKNDFGFLWIIVVSTPALLFASRYKASRISRTSSSSSSPQSNAPHWSTDFISLHLTSYKVCSRCRTNLFVTAVPHWIANWLQRRIELRRQYVPIFG